MKELNNTFFTTKSFLLLSACVITSLFYLQSLQAEPLDQRGPIPFHVYDINANDSISRDEFNTIQGQRMGQGQGMRGQNMGQGRGMNRGRNMPGFKDFDMNKDGYISEQELIEARSMRISSRIQQGYQMRNTANIAPFQEIDTNADGKISAEEFSAQQKQHQMGRQRPQ